MSFDNIIGPEDWFRRFFSSSRLPTMIGGSGTRRRTDDWFSNTFAGFDQIGRQMEKMFEEQLGDMQTKAPKE
ncbi:MAG TPA: hypothetical protein VE619_07045 [Nitrososphaeraceae archaeon]|nr:hypothetical protein [Nitrososphaeraceae archaeon]